MRPNAGRFKRADVGIRPYGRFRREPEGTIVDECSIEKWFGGIG